MQKDLQFWFFVLYSVFPTVNNDYTKERFANPAARLIVVPLGSQGVRKPFFSPARNAGLEGLDV